MTQMVRTHIPLPKVLKEQLKTRARQEKKSTAELARELLAEGLQKNRTNAGAVLLKIADKASEQGPSDLSRNIDKYLYEDAK